MAKSRARVRIHNYKSLRRVEIGDRGFQVLVGPNASGKSNVADALDFLADVYTHGLETAVAKKGGYDNICFRRQRRSKAPVRFEIRARVTDLIEPRDSFVVSHEFAFKAESESIRADFSVVSERIAVQHRPSRSKKIARQQSLALEPPHPNILELNRGELGDAELVTYSVPGASQLERQLLRLDRWREVETESTELAITLVSRLFSPLRRFTNLLGKIRVFQLSPQMCREPGAPTPNPELTRHGQNLPAVISYLESRHPKAYSAILSHLREIIPTLQSIQVKYTHRRTLTLDFKEEDVGRPWAMDDMSDGTVQALGILSAVFDPRSSIVVIEEPENSVHPWILRSLVAVCRDRSRQKQVIVTTHSPVLVNMLRPPELMIVSKNRGETRISPATKLDEGLKDVWANGDMSLYEFIDTGIIREAVPIFEIPAEAEE